MHFRESICLSSLSLCRPVLKKTLKKIDWDDNAAENAHSIYQLFSLGENRRMHHQSSDSVNLRNNSDKFEEPPLKLIVEAPPVTELVTETPLQNTGSAAAAGVIGGKIPLGIFP